MAKKDVGGDVFCGRAESARFREDMMICRIHRIDADEYEKESRRLDRLREEALEKRRLREERKEKRRRGGGGKRVKKINYNRSKG